MSGTADLVVSGFGSWSTATRIITKGFSIAEPTPPTEGGMEWCVPNTQLHWNVADTQLEYLIPNTRLEWASK